MNRIVENLEYLVRRHDCVVIPQWGAFVADYGSAMYDEEGGAYLPPRRDISFNPGIDHNDGLLAASIARHESIPYVKAVNIVASEVETMKHQLAADGEISLGAVGRFIYQKHSTPIFEPSNRLTQYASYGLSPVEAKPLIKVARAEHLEEEARQTSSRTLLRRRIVKAARIAAVFALLAVAAGVISIPTIFNRDDNFASVTAPRISGTGSSQLDIVPGVSSPKPAVCIPIPAEEPVKSQKFETTIDVKQVDAVAEVATAEKPIEETSPAMGRPDKYCLVVASLPSRQLAEKFIDETGDTGLDILASDGKYRVYAAKGPTSSEVEGMKRGEILSRYPDAWVCRMK